MPALLRRATRIATLSAALLVACAALPPAAHAYRASPGYGNEADLDRHDTYRNRDGDTVHAPAHSKSGALPRRHVQLQPSPARHVLGARRRCRVAVAPAERPVRTAAATRRCQRHSAAKYNSRSRRRHAATPPRPARHAPYRITRRRHARALRGSLNHF
jgi:Protein of unknown function (DUF3761)